jgi:hypothetical protein
MFLESDVNTKFSAFMDAFLYYFDTVFPLYFLMQRNSQGIVRLLKE